MNSRSADSGTPAGSRHGGEFPFLLFYGLLIGGVAFSTLDATAITTTGIDRSNGAIWTSAYVATTLVAIALSVPSAPKLAGRFGIRRVYAASSALGSASWFAIAVLVLAGVPPIPVLMIGAVVIGVFWGAFGGLSPLFAKSYCGGEEMAGSYARLSVASGIFWMLGSLGGGFMLDAVDPGWGLLVRAAFGAPLTIFVVLRPPAVMPPAPEIRERALATTVRRLRDNHALRRVALLGCGVAMFAAPLASLIVPIVDALRQSPLLPGAGILSAAMAIGELSSPKVVSMFERASSELRAAAVASLGAAFFLALYGLGSFATSETVELVIWGVVGIGFGAMRFGSKALTVGAAADADSAENSGESVAALIFVTCLAAPVGVLLWGVLINKVAVEAAIAFGVVGTVAVAGWFAWSRSSLEASR